HPAALRAVAVDGQVHERFVDELDVERARRESLAAAAREPCVDGRSAAEVLRAADKLHVVREQARRLVPEAGLQVVRVAALQVFDGAQRLEPLDVTCERVDVVGRARAGQGNEQGAKKRCEAMLRPGSSPGRHYGPTEEV